jgi:hypothetical protein
MQGDLFPVFLEELLTVASLPVFNIDILFISNERTTTPKAISCGFFVSLIFSIASTFSYTLHYPGYIHIC